MPEEISFAQTTGPDAEEHDPLLLHGVDIEEGSITFRADLEGITRQREYLLSPGTDARYMTAARRELHMSEPGISRRAVAMLSRETGKPVDPRTASPDECYLVHKIWFDSFS
jgi:hypothetical protein